MNLQEYSKLDGIGIADLIKKKEISKSEVATLAIRAIETMNPQINSVIEYYPERINYENNSKVEQPFEGVPMLLKDLAGYEANKKIEMGSRLAKGLVFDHDSELIKRYKNAGLNILGRTTTPEFGGSTTTQSIVSGFTRNPWNLKLSSGGSSGGSAAAVAAGLVPIAHATDLAGSIRIPSGFNGLVGLKPSRNLNPVGPNVGQLYLGLATEHVITKTVRDSAAILDSTAGPAPGEFYFTPKNSTSYLSAVSIEPDSLKIAVNLKPWINVKLDEEVKDAVVRAARLCEVLGHRVEFDRFDLNEEQVIRCMEVIWGSYTAYYINSLSKLTERNISQDTLEFNSLSAYNDGMKYSAQHLLNTIEYTNTVSRVVGHFFEKYDIMITPTNAIQAPEIKTNLVHNEEISWYNWVKNECKVAPFGQVFNISGAPSMTLPLGWTKTGMPIGITFSTKIGNEAMLFSLAAQLEIAQPWVNHIPKTHISNFN